MLALLFALCLLLAIGFIVLSISLIGMSETLPMLPILGGLYILAFGLFYFIWMGHNWDRWLTVGLFGSAFILSIVPLIMIHILLYLIISLFFLMLFLIFLVALIFSKSVVSFLNYQRSFRSKTLTNMERVF